MIRLFFIFLFLSTLTFNFCQAAEALRLVSLSPSVTETIFHLGKGSLLAGRSSACDSPEEAKKLPVAGNFGGAYLETLASLKPDIVLISSMSQSAKKSIENMGIKVIVLGSDSIDDYCDSLDRLGEVLDCKAACAIEKERIKNGLAERLAAVSKIPENKKPRVYLEVWNNPLMTAGAKSYVNDFITYAGGRNIASSQKRDYFQCSAEWVIVENPDVIISPAMGSGSESEFAQRPGWKNVNAVVNGRIYVNINQNLVYRLGPNILESIDLIHKCLYQDKKE